MDNLGVNEMKAFVKVQKEVEIKTVLINISPRHIGDDDDCDMGTDFPLLNERKTSWIARVDIDTGVIEGWPQGDARQMYVKVCDAGTYTLLDSEDKEIASIKNDYVPNGLIPGEYGDYIALDIDGTGTILNWPASPDVSEFFNDQDD